MVQASSKLDGLSESYIKKWAEFYPSEAFSNVLRSAAWKFENFSTERVDEKARIGDNFRTREFVDSVLQAGPIPIDALAPTFR